MARTREADNPMPPEGSWIKYRLDLRNIKFEEIAQKAGRSIALVSQVISGERRSEKVGAALAEALGFATYKDLMDAASLHTKGGAA